MLKNHQTILMINKKRHKINLDNHMVIYFFGREKN